MKSSLSLKTLSIPTLLLLLLVGCSSQPPKHYHALGNKVFGFNRSEAYIGYSGDIKPIEEVGVVTLDYSLYLQKINGVPAEEYRRLIDKGPTYLRRVQIHLPAGKHALKFDFKKSEDSYRYTSIKGLNRIINIEPNTVTHISSVHDRKRWSMTLSDGKEGLELIKKDFEKLLKQAGEENI